MAAMAMAMLMMMTESKTDKRLSGREEDDDGALTKR